MESPIILATDLDGTFLGGSQEDKQSLYAHISAERSRFRLIFVTGRDLSFVETLCQHKDMPSPDYVIGDVGTTVVQWPSRKGVPEIDAVIDTRWADAGESVRRLLADEPGIRLQPLFGQRRVSYYYNPDALRDETLHKISQAGFDCQLSAGVFLDVLPRAVNKGTTLLRLLRSLQWPKQNAVVCGDTLNDLSLFQTGIPGIVVGNAENKLKVEVDRLSHVYVSAKHGAGGIWDGLLQLGYLPKNEGTITLSRNDGEAL